MTEDIQNISSLPSVIPVFPLSGVILLPGSDLPLHIFEPRYRQMIEDAYESDQIIGMIQPTENEAGPVPELYNIGGAGSITSLTPLEDGRYLINLKGISRFNILQELPATTPYRQVAAEWLVDQHIMPDNFDRDDLIKLLQGFLSGKELAADFSRLKDMPNNVFIDTLSMAIPFEPAEKQALLEAESPWARTEIFTSLLQMAVGGNLTEIPN